MTAADWQDDKDTISVIGLGKLGAPLAACLSSQGFTVTGADLDQTKVDAINASRAPVFEPGLDNLIERCKGRLRATTDIAEAVTRSGATFIVVPTPSTSSGSFSLKYVLSACETIGTALRNKDGYHLVVLTSTVMPGSTAETVLPTLEKSSAKDCGADFGLCYSPEFIALGSVIRDFLYPDFLLIGESDRLAGDTLEKIYQRACETGPPVARMNFVNAELAKLAVNTFVTTKISFANMLARLCERLPGADVDEVTSALGLDARIGRKYLKGAISYGGPCFPRDNLALTALAENLGTPVDLASTTDRFNRRQITWLADVIAERLPTGGKVGVLGLTYKPGSDVVEESTGLLLLEELLARGTQATGFDPYAFESARRHLGDDNVLVHTPEECIKKSDIAVLATPWPELLELPIEVWAREGDPRTVIDCWRLSERLNGQEGITYLPLGVFPGA